jgi:hypothetical protein
MEVLTYAYTHLLDLMTYHIEYQKAKNNTNDEFILC